VSRLTGPGHAEATRRASGGTAWTRGGRWERRGARARMARLTGSRGGARGRYLCGARRFDSHLSEAPRGAAAACSVSRTRGPVAPRRAGRDGLMPPQSRFADHVQLLPAHVERACLRSPLPPYPPTPPPHQPSHRPAQRSPCCSLTSPARAGRTGATVDGKPLAQGAAPVELLLPATKIEVAPALCVSQAETWGNLLDDPPETETRFWSLSLNACFPPGPGRLRADLRARRHARAAARAPAARPGRRARGQGPAAQGHARRRAACRARADGVRVGSRPRAAPPLPAPSFAARGHVARDGSPPAPLPPSQRSDRRWGFCL
jgi:hypothetical protein